MKSVLGSFRKFAGVTLGLAMLSIAALSGPAAADDGGNQKPGPHHVVIQVSSDDAKTQNMALNNAANILAELGPDTVVKVVTYGPGLSMLTEGSPVATRLPALATEGVQFKACNNTMQGIKKRTGKLPTLVKNAEIEVVPSGAARIVELQTQGYAYLRP